MVRLSIRVRVRAWLGLGLAYCGHSSVPDPQRILEERLPGRVGSGSCLRLGDMDLWLWGYGIRIQVREIA